MIYPGYCPLRLDRQVKLGSWVSFHLPAALLIAAQRRSSFLDGQTGLGEEGRNQVWPSSKAGDGEVELLVQLFEVMAHQVAHLDILEMVPAAFIPRIEIGGIGRQRLKLDLKQA